MLRRFSLKISLAALAGLLVLLGGCDGCGREEEGEPATQADFTEHTHPPIVVKKGGGAANAGDTEQMADQEFTWWRVEDSGETQLKPSYDVFGGGGCINTGRLDPSLVGMGTDSAKVGEGDVTEARFWGNGYTLNVVFNGTRQRVQYRISNGTVTCSLDATAKEAGQIPNEFAGFTQLEAGDYEDPGRLDFTTCRNANCAH
jgi:hypothetical protein